MAARPRAGSRDLRGYEELSRRETAPDYARFLNIAEGSLAETEYLLLLSRDLGYIAAAVYEPLQREASEIARMLFALRTKVAPNDRS